MALNVPSLSPWWENADDVSRRRTQLSSRLFVEQHQNARSFLRDRFIALVVVSGGVAVLAACQLHAALLVDIQDLEHQHTGPVHWRAEQQQHRC